MANLGLEVLFNGSNLARLAAGLGTTVEIAGITIVGSFFLGLLIGILRLGTSWWLRTLLRCYLECFRIIPILVWLYLFYYFLPANFAVNLNAPTTAVIVFTLWGAAEMSDIVRAAVISLPRHQLESGIALGLSPYQLLCLILLPEALVRLTPAAVNLAVRIIMTTSLLFILGIVELIKSGQQIIESVYLTNPFASLWIYGVIFLIYFMLCYPLAKLADYLALRTGGGQ